MYVTVFLLWQISNVKSVINTCYQNDQFPGIEFLPPRCNIVHEVGVGGVQTFLVLVGEGAVILQDLVVHLL